LEPGQRDVGGLGAVDRLQRRHDRLAILPADEGQAIPDQMHNAGLNQGLRKYRRDRLWKAFEAVDDGDQKIVDASALELVDDFQPELGALGLLDPETEHLFLAIGVESERDIDRLVLDEPLVADLHPQGIEENDRINRIE